MPIQYSVDVTSNASTLAEQIARGQQANLKAAAIIWHAGIIRLLRGEGTGREYFVPGTGGIAKVPITVNVKSPRYKITSYTRMANKRTGRTYTASSPGDPPATRTGDLRTSYRFQVHKKSAVVGSPLIYALSLEKGTQRMAPRPHIKPAYLENKERIHAALEANVI